ncbi:3-hydroxyacyl-CoA dehydrogenase [Vulcanibacillus modesticaldus]|uniref:3-hydroxyacyl-CoA dehydrogenase n=1 Tax=Vulcanibacillus modesticaldus TaxID=337097 RepID=A0A1D2YSD0_9BACI|nr:3-hydroxyacyl-CoA dehydrogenase/enoyl-CoA hydratase family protein [Vulcanibacillus modesticaldus]OEF96927.1 3-hydroxyacyl-CoA dehydrogenase [Vulcanibacillus modesticaldus]
MKRKIKKAAVIGSGVMGAGIAAHLANVGIPTYMLDIVPNKLTPEEEKRGLKLEDDVVRNRIAANAKKALVKAKPAPLYRKEDADLITIGNLEDHLHYLSEADWIIEVVIENLEIKKKLFETVEKYRKPGSIVSSNTSGVSINEMIAGRSEEFKRHFLGTHFFNPPRYMKLLEIIPAKETDPEILEFMMEFGEKVLGKGVVLAKDTPNFIANRIGTYGLMVTIHEMEKMGLRVDEVDTITGPLMGRPKSASFRTLDMVGLDTFVHVANNVVNNTDDEKEKATFMMPSFVHEMVDKGLIGDKNRQGFYKKVKTDKGKEILVLDYKTMEYVPKIKLKSPSIEMAKQGKTLKDKLKTLIYGKDNASIFAWNTLKKVLLYSANKLGEISDDIVNIDNAMKWGFNWELGPFEIWDAIGVEKSVVRMKEEGEDIPEFVTKLLENGKKSFYEKVETKKFYFSIKGENEEIVPNQQIINIDELREQNRVIFSNAGASLIDMGDDVALLDFHSPNSAIGLDFMQMVDKSVEEVSKNYRGLVIGSQSKNFCVGANLMLILMEAEDENWDELNLIVKMFQNASMKLKYMDKPVVAAPYAMTLGGGTEITFGADLVQAAAETYMGLVEVGVGLIPAGGGTKELLYRNLEGIPDDMKIDLQPFVNRAFETIAMAKVSTSAREAQNLGYLRKTDRISVNKDHQLYEAKKAVLALDSMGYQAPRSKKIRVVGETGYNTLRLGTYTFRESGYISEHDQKIAEKLAFILSGGNVPANTMVTEQYLLDLEREAFLSLLGEPKTQQRMQHMLLKGKPLRN